MLSEINEKLDFIISSFKNNIVVDDNLDDVETRLLLCKLDYEYIDYDYKSKRVIDIYFNISDICDHETLYQYLKEALNVNNAYILNNFSKAVVISDLVYYNNNIFNFVINNNNLCNFCYQFSSYKTVRKILLYKNLLKKIMDLDDIDEQIIKNSIQNSDDRVFKLFCKYLNSENIKVYLPYLPRESPKYFLKRIKYLNKRINLKDYLKELLEIRYSNMESFASIIKNYQHNNIDYNLIKFNIIGAIVNKYDNMEYIKINYNLLKIICLPKLFIAIQRYLLINSLYIPFWKHFSIFLDILESNNFELELVVKNLSILKKCLSDNINIKYKFKFANYLSKFKYKLIKHLKYNRDLNIFMVLYSNYFPLLNLTSYSETKNLLNLLKLKSILRIKIREIIKKKRKHFEIKKQSLLREIINFEPQKKKILRYGSKNYQIVNQGFYTMKLENYSLIKNCYECNLILKRDGEEISRLPVKTENKILSLIKGTVNSVGIQNRYNIYDINISNLTYLERLYYLRKIHPYKLVEKYEASVLSEFKKIIELENKLEEKWYNKNNKNNDINNINIWYPVCVVRYTGDINILIKKLYEEKLSYLDYNIKNMIINVGNINYSLVDKC